MIGGSHLVVALAVVAGAELPVQRAGACRTVADLMQTAESRRLCLRPGRTSRKR